MFARTTAIEATPAASSWLRVDSNLLAKAPLGVVQRLEVEASEAAAFGMKPHELRAQRDTVNDVFDWQFQSAKERQAAKAADRHYETRTTVDEQGNQKSELVRTKATRKERFMDGQAERGKKVQAGLNRLGRRARELTRTPRKTGSSYGTDKGALALLSNEKTLPLDYGFAAQSAAKLANGVVAATEGAGDSNVSVATDVLTFGAPVLAVGDAMISMDAVLKLHCERDKAKADLLRCPEEAKRFWELLEEATPQEAEAFLRFEAAAEKLLHRTQEDRSTMAAATDRAVRLAGIQPVSVGAAVGIDIASHVVTSNPLLATVAPGLGLVTGGLHVHEGTHERLRRLDQQRRAEQRQVAMSKVLEANVGHPEFALLEGIVAALGGHQDRLIRQAKREKGYAKVRAGYGGASIGAGAAMLATSGLIAGGIIGGATLGAAAPVVAIPAVVWGGATAARNHARVRAEHRSKWRQRAMRVLGFEMSREMLEAKLAGRHLAEGPRLRVEFQEGEYLPKEGRFAGSREMEFDARENEYLGLHVLALRVQDLVESKGGYDVRSPFIQLLDAVGIDAIRLLAICKAASAKPADARLDFIQSQLAPALGMKLRVEARGVQALPHVSTFLRHFEDARSAAFEGQKILRELVKRYPEDPEGGLLAFETTVGSFLKKTEGLPQPDSFEEKRFILDLKEVIALIRSKNKAKRRFDDLRKAEDRKVEAAGKALAMREAAHLVEQLEQFGRRTRHPAALSPQPSPRG